MPSARAEIWVAYRNAQGTSVLPDRRIQAILRSRGFKSGLDADDWPAVDLASVSFESREIQVSRQSEAAPPEARSDSSVAARYNAQRLPRLPCPPLAAGHARRIFFNSLETEPENFGLGYEEIDENGVPVPGTFQDAKAFDPANPIVCVPLGPGNAPAIERWELVNISDEDHNFHMHQVHFRVLHAPEQRAQRGQATLSGREMRVDNLPLPHAEGECETVEDWRRGACTAHVARVEIPFALAGDFVYHCHILEHEDAGMMALIRVQPNALNFAQQTLDRMMAVLGLQREGAIAPESLQFVGDICRSRVRPRKPTTP